LGEVDKVLQYQAGREPQFANEIRQHG